ncbi:hypothetical protein ABZX85_50150 [Streptomyces sp. NPDC004539]|uniref:hypothetical protein n=1 Tax=Streptomyces sp. NPDC004539 TaxID=3154280 RepID=UPI0033AF644D
MGVKSYTAERVTYDLSVEGLRTYYVLAGSVSILIHNANGACPIFDREAERAQLPGNVSAIRGVGNNGDLLVTSSGMCQTDGKLMALAVREFGVLVY